MKSDIEAMIFFEVLLPKMSHLVDDLLPTCRHTSFLKINLTFFA